jgi:hypothetical protein
VSFNLELGCPSLMDVDLDPEKTADRLIGFAPVGG